MPNISVVIPVYNVEKYLAECLDSVISQSCGDIEIICVNDGSTDHSLDILEKYRKKDSRIQIISQANKGLAEARNTGMENAAGKYICFLDSDDMLVPNVLEYFYTAAESDHLELIAYEAKVQYEEENLYRKDKDKYYSKSHKYPGIRKGREFFTEMIRNGEYIDSACLLFAERDWINRKKIRFYPGIYYEDALFCLSCYFNADRMRHLPLKAYIYRIRSSSIMTSHPHFHNVYSCLINFKETMRVLLNIPDEESELSNALVKYMHLIVGRIKYLDDCRMADEKMPELAPCENLLEAALGVGKWKAAMPSDILLLSGLEKIVEDSAGTVLYGAGEIGKLLFGYLKERGLDDRIVCFAVTDRCYEVGNICEKNVRCIDDIRNKDYQIIMSADRRFQKDMKEKLQSFGIKNFIGIDRYTESILRKYMERKQKLT